MGEKTKLKKKKVLFFNILFFVLIVSPSPNRQEGSQRLGTAGAARGHEGRRALSDGGTRAGAQHGLLLPGRRGWKWWELLRDTNHWLQRNARHALSFVFQHVWLLKENIVSSFESLQLQHRSKRNGAERILRRCRARWIPSRLTLKHICSFRTPKVSAQ